MNKGTHFIGQPMYGQLLNLLNKQKILRFSPRGTGLKYSKWTIRRLKNRHYSIRGGLFSENKNATPV
ncbi:MAG: hypothetical protein IJ139_06145 [Bacteroidaceae bacterium]|nr:hypothetical protein [Bacteroidaceae bacterium]